MRRLLILLAAMVLVVVACSGGDTSGESDSAGEVEAPASTEAPAEVEGGGDTADDDSDGRQLGNGGATPTAAVNVGREIIFEAWVSVAVEDVAEAGAKAVAAVEGVGGFVFGQETEGAPNARTTLIFKVRPERFREALTALGDIGELRSQVISADDVTDRVVDLQSRIATLETSIERLRELLAGASDLKYITDMEAQLLQRETELEVIRGQLRTLEDRVSLATITLTITETFADPGLDVRVTAFPDADPTGQSCPGDSSLQVEEGSEVTVCFELVNTGDTMLSDFTLRDPVLGIDLEDLRVVFGEIDRPIEPGESVMLATVIDVERSLQTRARITALPTNPDGETLAGRAISRTVGISLRALERTEIPGFLSGFEGSVRMLLQVWDFLVLAAGALTPFALVGLVLWFPVRWLRRRFGQTEPIDTEVEQEEE